MKNKVLKTIVSSLLIVVMLFTAVPITASAATSGKCGDNLTWSFNESTGELTISSTDGLRDMYDYDYYTQPWDVFENDIVSIVINSGVASIGNYAFANCSSLLNVVISDSVTYIGNSAFECCVNLSNITIPDGVVTIGESAFVCCNSIANITIPDSVAVIGYAAFSACISLKSVSVGCGVESIGEEAFYCCNKLQKITVDSSNEYYSSDSYGVLYNKERTELVQYPEGNEREIFVVPDTVTAIGSKAFYSCDNLKDIKIGDNVTYIESEAFYWCNGITNISVPNSVIYIGNEAFACCNNLININVNDNNQYYSNDIDGVLYNKNKTKLIQYPIGNPRTSYKILDGVTTIGISAFSYCVNLTEMFLPSDIALIEYFALGYCDNITQIYCYSTSQHWNKVVVEAGNEQLLKANFDFVSEMDLPSGVCGENLTWKYEELTNKLEINGTGDMYSYIDHYRPWESYIDEIKYVFIGEGIGSVGDNSFAGCENLINVEIPRGVISIGDYAFWECINLTEITMPNTVTYIGNCAFCECDLLSDVYYYGTSEQWEQIYIDPYGDGNGNLPLEWANIHFLSEPETPTYTITYNANGGSNAPASQTKTENVSITLSKSTPTRSGYTFLGWSTNKNATAAQYKPGATFSVNANTTLYAVWSKEEIYNLGEETYSFDNFGDSDSSGGHCFGMSITSSGYYLNELDVTDIGLNDSSELYTVSKTAKVKKPICYYQGIQGTYSRNAIVAGGTRYKYGYADIASDWDEVVRYVKNHKYDNTGELQIGFQKVSQGGHAINFLRYENVNGEDRIYAYDNNFPNTETYFCKGSDGKVYQKPYSTFSGAIDCIALRSVAKYFDLAGDFDSSRVIYGWAETIYVEGVTGYPMDLGGSGEYMMYEIPDGVDEVVIVPLTDNATFEYMNEDYQFGGINEETYGVFTLSTSESSNDESFVIENEQSSVDEVFVYDLDMTYKSYAWIESEIYVTGNADYTVEYSSSNPSVAYVDEFGEVYAAGEGSADITVTVTDEYGNVVTDTCKVKVSYAWWQWIIRILLLGFLWY